MDSVAIAAWDHNRVRAFCSGFGYVMDTRGEVVLSLGEELVPHGQELRVARFDDTMQPDDVQRENKPFECRFILLGALSLSFFLSVLRDRVKRAVIFGGGRRLLQGYSRVGLTISPRNCASPPSFSYTP